MNNRGAGRGRRAALAALAAFTLALPAHVSAASGALVAEAAAEKPIPSPEAGEAAAATEADSAAPSLPLTGTDAIALAALTASLLAAGFLLRRFSTR